MIRILRKTQEGNKKGHQEGGQAIDLHRNTSTWSARPLHRLRGFFACDSLNVSSYYERRASHELSARTGRPSALHSFLLTFAIVISSRASRFVVRGRHSADRAAI